MASDRINIQFRSEYIVALVNNDVSLLEELYSKYSPIKRMVIKNNGSEADAEDIFQDVLLSIYNKAKNENFVLAYPLDAFIYLIAKNKWINELNKKKVP